MTCEQPVGHHLMKSCQDTLQENLREAIQKVPVEPPKAPSKVVQPFPRGRARLQQMPPPLAPMRLSFRLNRVAKMRTGPPSQKNQMLAAITTTPHMTIHKLTLEDIESLTSSVKTTLLLSNCKIRDAIRLKKKFSPSKLKNKSTINLKSKISIKLKERTLSTCPGILQRLKRRKSLSPPLL